jgi:hypothetical protein
MSNVYLENKKEGAMLAIAPWLLQMFCEDSVGQLS